MKKIYIFLLILLASITSCQKASINGDLDGMWQLMKIEYKDQTFKSPDQLYYCVQLHMVQFQGAAMCSGTFSHSGDSLRVVIRNHKAADVSAYGMNDTIQSFFIEKLSSEKMVLHSSFARLSFRKF
jgi:hypothetical protein